MSKSASKPEIRDLEILADLDLVLRLEKEVWGLEDADVTPITLAVALKAAGSICLGAFDDNQLVGFALAFPSLERGRVGFHSHMLAVSASHRGRNLGYELKLVQRQRALALGVREMTWTFDPLRSRNAHLNFHRLGVISDTYRVDFYGPQTSSPLHRNGTDRLWVTWHMADSRVEERLKEKNPPKDRDRNPWRHRPNGKGRPRPGARMEACHSESLHRGSQGWIHSEGILPLNSRPSGPGCVLAGASFMSRYSDLVSPALGGCPVLVSPFFGETGRGFCSRATRTHSRATRTH